MRKHPLPHHGGAPRRTSALTITALVTLAAVSASVAAAPAPASASGAEPRLESTMARAVAAVVAAAARDFLGAKQSASAAVLLEPLAGAGAAGDPRPAGWPAVAAQPSRLLGERLLDLPPPTC